MDEAVYTIGHSNHLPEQFVELLERHAITAVGDVRSRPYSRMNPQFNRENLKRLLAARGIATRVVMIGSDDDRAPVDGLDVVYLGLQPREVVRGALRAARVLVNMSASESFGIVLLEAWLAGTPVIANHHCIAFGDLVEDGVNGFLVDNVNDVAERVAALLTTPVLGMAMAECGREVAIGYTWSKPADELDALCTQLAGSRYSEPQSSSARS